MIKTTKAQRQAIARYQKNSVRWTASAKKDTDKAALLNKAKADVEFVKKFWLWLSQNY